MRENGFGSNNLNTVSVLFDCKYSVKRMKFFVQPTIYIYSVKIMKTFCKIYSHPQKNFVKLIPLVTFLVKPLLSRNFCQKSVRDTLNTVEITDIYSPLCSRNNFFVKFRIFFVLQFQQNFPSNQSILLVKWMKIYILDLIVLLRLSQVIKLLPKFSLDLSLTDQNEFGLNKAKRL